MNDKSKEVLTWGVVVEALPGPRFRVLVDEGQVSTETPGVRQTDEGLEIIAYLSGKMRVRRIRVIIGDRVGMQFDRTLGGQARIVIRG